MGFLGKPKGNKSGSQHDALGAVNDMPLQAKMRYGQADDAYEQEADRVADSVVNNSARGNAPGRSPAMAPSISNYVQKQGDDEQKDATQQDMEKQKTKNEESGEQKKDEALKEEEQTAQKKGDKKEEEKPVQKKSTDNKEEEKKVQKKEDKKEEEKPVQKKGDKKEEEKPVQKKEDKKEEEKPVQKKGDKKEEEKPVQKKGDKKEEEKPVQKKGDKKEERPAQKKGDKKEEEKPVQKKEEGKKEEEKPVQKKESNNPKAEDPDVEKQILASKNGGRLMEDDVRKEMEKQFGKDFKGVKIHNDAQSYELCRKINAQAFTHGNHIYFGEGKYNPEATEGKRLLAHELTHVVQQGHDVRRKMIQKNGTSTTTATPSSALVVPAGRPLAGASIDIGGSQLTIPEVSIPQFKQRHSGSYSSALEYKDRGNTTQTTQWRQAVESGVTDKLGRKKAEAEARGAKAADGTYFFKGRRRQSLMLIGREGGFSSSSGDARTSLLETFIFPIWDRDQQPTTFQVDHKKEMQLGGDDNSANYELLEAAANGSSGSVIMHDISSKINTSLTELKKLDTANTTLQGLNEQTVKQSYKITFNRVRYNLPVNGNPSRFWRVDQVSGGSHMDDIIPMSPRDIENLGSKTNPKVFSSPAGGQVLDASGPYPKRNWMQRVDLLQVMKNADESAVTGLVVRAYKSGATQEGASVYAAEDSADNLTWNVIPIAGVYGGAIDKASIAGTLRTSLRLPGLSPIQLNSVELLEGVGIQARGKVLPTVPVVRNADIDITITGAEVDLRKTFNAGEFSLPSPFHIDNVALSVFLNSRTGIGVDGQVNFSIQNVGQGHIGASASTGGGFNLEGEFNFDSSLFEPARVRVTYHDQQWTVTGQIGIPPGKVKGIKRGMINITYANETLTATGDVEPDIKGIQRGNMSAVFNADGFLISGDFTLSNEIPGIRGGNVSASLEKTGDEYKVKASGSAQPAIPGIDATLSIEYDNGALKIEGQAAYQRGILSGNIRIGATNRSVGADGQPTGDPTDTFILYGGGEVTVQITPWLQGTVGVNFLPNGQMEVSGRIGIPSPIDVFPRKEIPEQDLFSIGVDIPIFAIPLGPRSIGLKATIAGALKAYAGIGPGRLEQLELGITYNPDQPENTHITGTGSFVVPADAGLKLAVRASIGVDAAIAGVEGGIEVAGGLGLEATASASVSIDWTPSAGLELNADLSADVQPKFTFNIDGFIRAWVLFYEHEWRKRFANYEYGSNLNFGITLPIHYKEGEAFDVSYEDIEFRKPDIDATSFVGGLLRDLA